MKKKSLTHASIIVWSIVLVLAIAALSVCAVVYRNGGFPRMFNFGFQYDASNYITLKEETVADTITDVRFNWISGQATFHKTAEDTIRIIQKGASGYPEDQLFTYRVQNGELIIEDRRKNIWSFLSWNRHGANLEVYLPDRVYNTLSGNTAGSDVQSDPLRVKTLRLESASGDIRMPGEFEDVTINTVSGSVFLEGCKANRFGVGTTSGDIHLKDSAAINIDIGTTSGDMNVDGCALSGQLIAHTTSGEIRGQNVTAVDLRTDTVSGDVKLAGEFTSLAAYTTSGSISVSSSKMLRRAEVSSVSGDLRLTLPENDGFTAQFHKVSGDFRCDFPTTQAGSDYVYNDGSAELTLSTTSGDFHIFKAG